MNGGYLLDANIISALMRDPNGKIASKIAEVGEDAVATSVIVASELRFGAEKKASPRLTAQLEAILAAIDVLPFEPPADRFYAKARLVVESAGEPIGANYLLIAAHALAHEMALVTDNEKEFARVPLLKVENWLKE